MGDAVGAVDADDVGAADDAAAVENSRIVVAVFDFGEARTAVIAGGSVGLKDDMPTGDRFAVVRDGAGELVGSFAGGAAGEEYK